MKLSPAAYVTSALLSLGVACSSAAFAGGNPTLAPEPSGLSVLCVGLAAGALVVAFRKIRARSSES